MGVHETLLHAHAVLRTRDLDEARATVAGRYCQHRLNLVSGRSLSAFHNHARGVHISLNVLGYGGHVAIDPGELTDFYLLQIPLAGHARIAHRGEEVEANARCGTILNPDRPSQMVWRADCVKLMVQIDKAFLARVAVEESGLELPGQVRFDPKVNLNCHVGRRLKTLSLAAARSIDDGTLPLAPQELSLLSMERHLVGALLERQPSNVSHLLTAGRRAVSALHLRRAISYIQDSHHEAISLQDMARAAGAHPRTLQAAFQKAMGVTPMQFLRDVRLDHARYHLMRRRHRPSVTEIAFDCGYTHLGRFSRDFKARFGQSPRDV